MSKHNVDLTELAIDDRLATAYTLIRDRALAAGQKPPATDDPDTIRRVQKIVVSQLLLDRINLDLEGPALRVERELDAVRDLERQAGALDAYGRRYLSRFGQRAGMWWLQE
jgi:hypothetical protein